MAEFSGTPAGAERRFAVVASRFNESVVEKLLDGALDALVKHGVAADNVDVVWVPGAWELPIAARRLLASERYDAIVAVGAVIRGDTPHFDYVAGEASRGLQSASPRQLELMRSYAASELEIWRRVRVPSALPYVFTALKVASVLAMIGAIVGEYFGGAFNALGVLIRSDAQVFNFQRAWAGILVASLLGLSFYGAVVIAERFLVRWAPEAREP